MAHRVAPRHALVLFIVMLLFLIAQAVWWVVFMAQLVDEKVELAEQLGAGEEFIERIHEEEIHRQIMVGLEGVFFLVILMIGLWIIYRSIVRLHQLRFHQENFMMAVTHELKTPLSSLNLYLDSLHSTKISEEKKAAILPRMKADVRRLHKLVDNVLEAGRFDRSRLVNRKSPFNLTELIEETLALLETTVASASLHFGKNLQPEVVLHGDRESMGRALYLVLENCARYNTSETKRIRIDLSERKDQIQLDIADNGIGLERKELRAIFDRFYRVGSELVRNYEGSGLGLYLSKEIIAAHGGTIDAHSEGPNRGTTFMIRLKK